MKRATLTAANAEYRFTAPVGQSKHIATSGVVGPATIKLQHRVDPADSWVDSPNLTFTASAQFAGVLQVAAGYNRVVVVGADGTTAVNLSM
jgi:hypothetical protein